MRILRLRRPLRRLTPLVLTALAAVTLAAGAFTTPAHLPAPETTPSAAPAPPVSPPPAAQSEVEAEVVVLHPTGFEPSEISRPAGRILFAVDNRSGEDELVLRLEEEGGKLLHEARAGRRTNVLRKVLTLRPGVYVITEASNPEWRCRITITH